MLASIEDLEKSTTTGIITCNENPGQYKTVLEYFAHHLCLITDRECKLALHALYRTACLYATLSNGTREDTRKSVRYK